MCKLHYLSDESHWKVIHCSRMTCYGWTVLLQSPMLKPETWAPQMGLYLKRGLLKGWLSYKGWALVHYDWCVLIRRRNVDTQGDTRSAQADTRSREDIARRQTSTSWGDRPQQKPTLPAPRFWSSSLQSRETNECLCSSHPVCNILLWLPKQMNTTCYK